MKKCLLGALLLVKIQTGAGQDYIITWANDTIACRFPAKPGKEGFRPAWKYKNGHLRVLTIFANDSIRVINAGEIKGYFRKEHGKSLLCDGFFEAKKVGNSNQPGSGDFETRQVDQWYFMNRVLEGKFASLYMIYLPGRNSPQPVYLVTKHDNSDPLTAFTIWNYKSARKVLADGDVKTAMEDFLSGKRKRFKEMVKEYNRLKAANSSPDP